MSEPLATAYLRVPLHTPRQGTNLLSTQVALSVADGRLAQVMMTGRCTWHPTLTSHDRQIMSLSVDRRHYKHQTTTVSYHKETFPLNRINDTVPRWAQPCSR